MVWGGMGKRTRPTKVHEGRSYYLSDDGHWRRHTSLHRDVWEAHFGLIPDGYAIHHKDHDKENNDISNLELLTPSEHQRRHHAELPEKEHICEHCGTVFTSKSPTGRSRFCSSRCCKAWFLANDPIYKKKKYWQNKNHKRCKRWYFPALLHPTHVQLNLTPPPIKLHIVHHETVVYKLFL